jgi:5-methylcytosine-specific restriction endonuclease McrA
MPIKYTLKIILIKKITIRTIMVYNITFGQLNNRDDYMTELGKKIIELRTQNPKYSYDYISRLLNCSPSTVFYHLNDGRRTKMLLRAKIHDKKNGNQPHYILYRKLNHFRQNDRNISLTQFNYKKSLHYYIRTKLLQFTRRNKNMANDATLDAVKLKVGNNPICYLTGDPLDLTKPRSFSFDHIVPVSRGGDNSIDNLGICTRMANMSKTNMTVDEYLNLCKKILEHNGYKVEKI